MALQWKQAEGVSNEWIWESFPCLEALLTRGFYKLWIHFNSLHLLLVQGLEREKSSPGRDPGRSFHEYPAKNFCCLWRERRKRLGMEYLEGWDPFGGDLWGWSVRGEQGALCDGLEPLPSPIPADSLPQCSLQCHGLCFPAGSSQKCYSEAIPSLNSTAWFRNFLGSFLEHATVEDLQLFGDEPTVSGAPGRTQSKSRSPEWLGWKDLRVTHPIPHSHYPRVLQSLEIPGIPASRNISLVHLRNKQSLQLFLPTMG